MGIIEKNSNIFDLTREFYINFVDLEKSEEEHTHNFIEIVYTLHGKGVHRVDGEEVIVKGGSVLLINYHQKHEIVPLENLRYVDIMLKPEFLSDTLRGTDDLFLLLRLSDFMDVSDLVKRENVFLQFDGEERRRMEFLIDWVRMEQAKPAPAGFMILHSSLLLILSILFRKMTEAQEGRLSLNKHLLEYMDRNACNRLSVRELSEKCGYTAEHFSRLFKKHTGKTPVEYMMECRIKKAKRLLLHTDLPVETVVFECGFSNRTAFFKKFFELVGETPLQYRKNQK